LNNTIEPRRRPAQERSKKRVDAILNAAKSLITEKGCARLKIHDIASRADVTPASIYQYFPNKNAITMALAEATFGATYEILAESLPVMSSKQEMYQVLRGLVEQYYQAYLNDPAMLDVWVSISADKSMHEFDLQDSRRTADLIYQCMKQFYPESQWERISKTSFLLAHLSGSAVRMALSVGPEEGRALMDAFLSLISPTSLDDVLGYKQKSQK